MPAKKRILDVDPIEIQSILAQMHTYFDFEIGATPIDPAASATFDYIFHKSIEHALGDGGVWKRDKKAVLALLSVTGALVKARVTNPWRTMGNKILEQDIVECLASVRDTACPVRRKGRWCNFIDGQRRRLRRSSPQPKRGRKRAQKK